MNIWVISIALEVFLCLWLLYRGHVTRYYILFLSLIFELIAGPVLSFIYDTYGTLSKAYYSAFHIKNFLTLVLCLSVVWEGFLWSNRRLRIPYEFYTVAMIGKFMTEKLQFLATSHAIYEMIRYSRIAILIWLIFIFRKEPKYAKTR